MSMAIPGSIIRPVVAGSDTNRYTHQGGLLERVIDVTDHRFDSSKSPQLIESTNGLLTWSWIARAIVSIRDRSEKSCPKYTGIVAWGQTPAITSMSSITSTASSLSLFVAA